MRFAAPKASAARDAKWITTINCPLIEVEQLKQQIAEAVRTTLRELADERGMSVADFIDSIVANERKTP